jgi:hypothetical protein
MLSTLVEYWSRGGIFLARSSPSRLSSLSLLVSGGRSGGRQRREGVASPAIRPSLPIFVIYFGCAGAATKVQIFCFSDLIHGGWTKEGEDLRMASPISSPGLAKVAIFNARLPESVAGPSGLMASRSLCRGFGMALLLLQTCLLFFSPELLASWWRQARECAEWRC